MHMRVGCIQTLVVVSGVVVVWWWTHLKHFFLRFELF